MWTTLLAIAAAGIGAYYAGGWLFRAFIRRRLRGYRVTVETPDPRLPERAPADRPAPRVAVIGSGIAGLTAATTLAGRGLRVSLFEAKAHLGGKLGAWPVTLPNGETVGVSHGYHAFFRQYYNLNRWLDARGLRREFRSIGEYTIFSREGGPVSFGALETTPVLNLIALMRSGMYSLGDVMKPPARDLMGIFLEYDAAWTFGRYDQLSFADFARVAKLPRSLKVAFGTFSRAFFADDDKISLAEMIKSFHFYYLSQAEGLVYDYPTRDYAPAFLDPLRDELSKHGAELRLSTPVDTLAAEGGGFLVNGERFDDVIVSADVVGARHIMARATGVPPELNARFEKLRPGQRYAVWRMWIDRDVRADMPVFVITDKIRVLDAFAVYHRLEKESADYVARHGGAIIELHCYAVPEDLESEAELRAEMERELLALFPELTGYTRQAEFFQLERNFTAFHVGLAAERPRVDSGVPGLSFAGDWVWLDFPAMLMEAACSSGLVAANRVLTRHGLRTEQVDAVPPRGFMAGFPQPPTRAPLLNLPAERR